jgi:hypothetical protein
VPSTWSEESRAATREPRDELWDREVFDTLLEAKVLIERWAKTYNTTRPHNSLGYRPPAPESRRPCPRGSEKLRVAVDDAALQSAPEALQLIHS